MYTEIGVHPNKHTLENEMSDTREAFYKAFPRHAGVIEMHEQGAIGHLDAMTAIHQFAVWQAATEQSAKEIAELRTQLAAEQALRVKIQAALKYAIDDLTIRATLSDDDSLNIGQGCLDQMHEAMQTSPTAALDAKIAEAEIKVLEVAYSTCKPFGEEFRHMITERKARLKQIEKRKEQIK
jgi:hypothetical protein